MLAKLLKAVAIQSQLSTQGGRDLGGHKGRLGLLVDLDSSSPGVGQSAGAACVILRANARSRTVAFSIRPLLQKGQHNPPAPAAPACAGVSRFKDAIERQLARRVGVAMVGRSRKPPKLHSDPGFAGFGSTTVLVLNLADSARWLRRFGNGAVMCASGDGLGARIPVPQAARCSVFNALAALENGCVPRELRQCHSTSQGLVQGQPGELSSWHYA